MAKKFTLTGPQQKTLVEAIEHELDNLDEGMYFEEEWKSLKLTVEYYCKLLEALDRPGKAKFWRKAYKDKDEDNGEDE